MKDLSGYTIKPLVWIKIDDDEDCYEAVTPLVTYRVCPTLYKTSWIWLIDDDVLSNTNEKDMNAACQKAYEHYEQKVLELLQKV